ncbi:MAG: hypothetical protein Q9187_002443 [Circinaria calcarea]
MAASSLMKIPVEIQCQILDLILCPSEENVIENPIFDFRVIGQDRPLVNMATTLLDVSILDTCKSLRSVGLHVLYAKNTIRFTSPHDAKNFILHPKANNHTRLIKYLELEIDVFGPYLDGWVNFFRGNCMCDFRVKWLEIVFPSGPYRIGSGPVWADEYHEFAKIQQALVDKVRVPEVRVFWLSTDGYDAGRYLEDAMIGCFDGGPTEAVEDIDNGWSEGQADMQELALQYDYTIDQPW